MIKKIIVFLGAFLFLLSALNAASASIIPGPQGDQCVCKATFDSAFDPAAERLLGNCPDSTVQINPELPGYTQTCADSDGGISEFVKGTITGYRGNEQTHENYAISDFCSPCASGNLVEFYCMNTDYSTSPVPTYRVMECQYGCDDGKCKDGPNVPEFSIIAASMAFIGAGAGYLFLRKKN